MHRGQVEIDDDVVGRLLASQFPDLATLPLRAVRSIGTVNALFRLGDELCVRLPLVATWAGSIERELEWLPRISSHLSIEVPEPLQAGEPTDFYPFRWAIYRWIPGEPYSDDLIRDEASAASDLARFVTELRALEPRQPAPRGGRRPLAELDEETRTAIEASNAVIDADAAMAVWERSLDAPVWDGSPVWIHGDLLRPNLLVSAGRLSGVLDFGGVGLGDPATDLTPAWSVFGESGRETFRRILGPDDGTWARGRGIALHQAALIIPYYSTSNPDFVKDAERTIGEVLLVRSSDGGTLADRRSKANAPTAARKLASNHEGH